MKPVFFNDQHEFREWLRQNHQKSDEIIVGYYKKATGKPSMTWSESVDQALCFGWIDGIRRSVDSESYSIRFTPRRKSSNWSKINIRKVEELTKNGLMTDAGLAAFNERADSRAGIYSYENEPATLDENLEMMIRSSSAAWDFFMKQPPSHRKTIARWIMSGKQEKTRLSRMQKLISACEAGIRLF